MTLRISPGLSLPLDTVTDTIAVLAVKGSGKTYCASVIAEEMIGTGQPVVVVDPVGVAWGLRLAANGKDPGLNVIIFGGEKGDVPLEPGAGHLIADFVVQERRSCVLDLSAFETKADQRRFLLDFTQRVYKTNREPLHVILDEADDYIPQKPFGDETHLLRAFEVLVRRGRARGIGVTMITQRAAVINKSVLTQTSILVVGRTTSPQDRKAVEAWVEGHSTVANVKTFWDSLAALPKEEKWVWAPGLELFERVHIRDRKTFDSSSTPKVGAVRATPRELAPIDLESLRGRIAATIEKAKDEDPKALRARVKELEAQLAKREPERVEVPVIYEPVMRAVAETMRGLDAMKTALLEALAQSEIDGAKVRAVEPPPAPPKMNGAAHQPRPREPLIVSPPTTLQMLSRERALSDAGVEKLRKGERTMLEALARHHPTKLTRSQLGTLAGLASGGGTFSTYLGVLKRHALVELVGELVSLTPAGLKAAGGKGPPMTRAEIVSIWKDKLRAGERRMLDVVLTEGDVSREDLASISAIEMSGGTFSTYLGVLKRNDLVITVGNRVRLGTALAEAS